MVESMDLKTYLPVFIEESKDNIQQMSENLLRLEEDYGDAEVIDEIFRAIHTIKGMSATMGYTQLSNLAHQAENLLDEVRHGRIAVSPAMINGFFKVIDEIEEQLSVLGQTGEPKALDNRRLEEIKAHFAEARRADAGAAGKYRVEIVFSKDCLLRPARALVVLNQLAGVGNILHSDPPQDKLPSLDNLDKLVCHIAAASPQQVHDVLAGGVEIDSYTLEELREEAGQTSAAKPAEPQVNRNISTVRVDTEKLDHLLNLVSELVINKTSLQEAVASFPSLADDVEHLHRLTSELQNIVMNMRMIPLETVFNRFPRMIRDTAKALNKSVHFEIVGADTELDRTIIEDIADPLLHLLRNAVDHGIEPVAIRTSLGKPAAGKIVLRAYQTGNQVVIEVEDDGAGLDLDKIKAKAREMGLWQGQEPDDAEAANFIFAPGFTTSDRVTDLSGRGVGLDVVKKSIEALGGNIEVISNKNAGSTFRISLPLTLAIIQGLSVKCGDEIYVIPLSYIQETEIIYPDSIQTLGQQQIYMLRGQVLPVVFLADLLGFRDYVPLQEMSLVVVHFGERLIGIIVDDLLSQQDIVIKNVSWGQGYFSSFLGSTILGNGRIVLILDINNLLAGVKVREVKHA